MDKRTEESVTNEALAAMSGKVDALTAAVLGFLELSRSIPELSVAIREHMATQYINQVHQSEDPRYRQGFGDMRAQILNILR